MRRPPNRRFAKLASASAPSVAETLAQLNALRLAGLTRGQRSALTGAPYATILAWESEKAKPSTIARYRVNDVYQAFLLANDHAS